MYNRYSSLLIKAKIEKKKYFREKSDCMKCLYVVPVCCACIFYLYIEPVCDIFISILYTLYNIMHKYISGTKLIYISILC